MFSEVILNVRFYSVVDAKCQFEKTQIYRKYCNMNGTFTMVKKKRFKNINAVTLIRKTMNNIFPCLFQKHICTTILSLNSNSPS